MYSIYIYNPKSKAVTNNINKIKKRNPNFSKNNCIDPDKGLLNINSYVKSKIYPPSNAGIGNRFIKPKLIDNIAIKKIIDDNPLSKLVPEILAIPIGPSMSSLLISNVNIAFKPLNHSIVILIESKIPNLIAGKTDKVINLGAAAVIPILPIIFFVFLL